MYKVIASGSTGNCEIYHSCIAVDMGIPYSKIEPYINDLRIVMLSHLHLDHFNIATIKKLSFERPSLRFACGEWMAESLKGVRNVDILELNKWYDYGEFEVSIGKSYHDIKNCFFRIVKDGYKIFRATDTYTLSGITAKGYDLYAIEHNYNEDTIRESIYESDRKGEYSHQRGSFNSHLSEQQARDFIFKNKGEKYEVLRLHESSTQL